jgi:D-alanyl-D-alanine carboxypeptidase
MRSLLALVYGALCLTPAVTIAYADEPVPAAKIDADMNAAIARHQTVGMTIAVVRDGSIVYERAYGERNAAGNLPATLATQYEIGSITKQFTAAAIMQLVDAGKISLMASLSTYLPKAPHASEVTIAQLLSHTSGIPDYLEGKDVVAAASHAATFDELLARIDGKPLLFPPGTQWSYSNTNYLLLGRVIEMVSGEPYEQYLFDHVLTKVSGSNFSIMADESKLPNVASGYADGKPETPLDNSWAWSAGNLVGTVSDMVAWDAALSGGQVVPPSDYAAMTSVQTPPGAKEPYGFGFLVDRYDGQPRIWHNGGTFGFNASDQLYPNQRTRIIVLTNDAGGQADDLAQRIFDDLYPQIAAEGEKPASGEDAAYTARVKLVFGQLLAGKIDRAQFDARANAALTDALIAQASAQFRTLGSPQSFTFRGCTAYGGGKVCKYLVTFPTVRMVLTVGNDADGKFNTIFLGDQ